MLPGHHVSGGKKRKKKIGGSGENEVARVRKRAESVTAGLSQACSSPIKQDFSLCTSDSLFHTHKHTLTTAAAAQSVRLGLVSTMKAAECCV